MHTPSSLFKLAFFLKMVKKLTNIFCRKKPTLTPLKGRPFFVFFLISFLIFPAQSSKGNDFAWTKEPGFFSLFSTQFPLNYYFPTLREERISISCENIKSSKEAVVLEIEEEEKELLIKKLKEKEYVRRSLKPLEMTTSIDMFVIDPSEGKEESVSTINMMDTIYVGEDALGALIHHLEHKDSLPLRYLEVSSSYLKGRSDYMKQGMHQLASDLKSFREKIQKRKGELVTGFHLIRSLEGIPVSGCSKRMRAEPVFRVIQKINNSIRNVKTEVAATPSSGSTHASLFKQEKLLTESIRLLEDAISRSSIFHNIKVPAALIAFVVLDYNLIRLRGQVQLRNPIFKEDPLYKKIYEKIKEKVRTSRTIIPALRGAGLISLVYFGILHYGGYPEKVDLKLNLQDAKRLLYLLQEEREGIRRTLDSLPDYSVE